jgi:hypothetical protein
MSETDDELLKERVRRMLDHCEMSNVQVLEFSAKRFDEANEPASAHITSDTSYLVNEDAFRNRYVWEAELVDSSAAPVARLNATLLVEYDIREGFEPDAEAAEAIASSTGFFAAYPYVRELFQSSTARLQIDPMVLGMLLAGSTHPRGVTITRTSDYDHLRAATPEEVGELATDRGSSES